MNTPTETPAAVHTIHAYRLPRYPETWVFDDERAGRRQEPFVAGASEAIDRLAAECFGRADRITVEFSVAPLPDAQRVLRRVGLGLRPSTAGASYDDGVDEIWLSPALVKYFDCDPAPKTIYLRARSEEASRSHP